MIERLLLVAWKGSQSVGWAETFRSSGYTVLVEETTGERAWRTAKERGIDCVVIDGEKKPSLGRQTGYQLRDTAKTRGIPIVWANLNPDEASLVQADVHPDVTLPRPTDASEVIAAIVTLDMAFESTEPPEEEEAPSQAVSPNEPPLTAASPRPPPKKRAAAKATPPKTKKAVAKPRTKPPPAKEPARKGKATASHRVVARKALKPKVRKPSS
jgi:hypothetical protein